MLEKSTGTRTRAISYQDLWADFLRSVLWSIPGIALPMIAFYLVAGKSHWSLATLLIIVANCVGYWEGRLYARRRVKQMTRRLLEKLDEPLEPLEPLEPAAAFEGSRDAATRIIDLGR